MDTFLRLFIKEVKIMAKEFKDWVDEFVKNGANPKNVPNWPEEAGGTKVVSELPQVGEEYTIYEL